MGVRPVNVWCEDGEAGFRRCLAAGLASLGEPPSQFDPAS